MKIEIGRGLVIFQKALRAVDVSDHPVTCAITCRRHYSHDAGIGELAGQEPSYYGLDLPIFGEPVQQAPVGADNLQVVLDICQSVDEPSGSLQPFIGDRWSNQCDLDPALPAPISKIPCPLHARKQSFACLVAEIDPIRRCFPLGLIPLVNPVSFFHLCRS